METLDPQKLTLELTLESLCNIIQQIHTDNPDCSDVDVNTGIVFGATSIGIGYSQCNVPFMAANTFASKEPNLATVIHKTSIEVPFMAANTFASKEPNLATVIHKTSIEAIEEAGVEEAQLAREAGDIASEGIVIVVKAFLQYKLQCGFWSGKEY
ncbi:hypothetical protein QE152_g27449 [Popillia japonica]|uniref:Uncharacterized protein n=1 Tax=Popillia japonica TaxID=7064 RepID=A0AAW1JUD9_POPJA